MSDAALENAHRRHNEISKQIADLGRKIEYLKREQERIGKFIEAWHEFADTGGDTGLRTKGEIAPAGPLPDTFVAPAISEERKKRTTGNPKKEEVAEAARAIIRERGHPVSRSELFAALKGHGVELRGADPEMVLSTMLWRMKDRVVRLKSGGYWLADEAFRDAGYFPDDDDVFPARDDSPPPVIDDGEEDESATEDVKGEPNPSNFGFVRRRL